MINIRVILCFLSLIHGTIYCCEVEERRVVSETYTCNKTQTIWTKEKCMLFFQCDKQIQTIVPASCVRNVTVTNKLCCLGYVRDEKTGLCLDVDECSLQMHNCASTCVNLPGGYKCDCPPGYNLAEDDRTCLDINECDNEFLHNCSHSCKNSEGSYTCLCPGSWRLQVDGRTCEEDVAQHKERIHLSIVEFVTSSLPISTILPRSDVIMIETPASRVAENNHLLKTHYIVIWVGAGFAIIAMAALLGFAVIYRRRRNKWPWYRVDGSVVWRKPYNSPTNSVADMINTSAKSKVLDDSIAPSVLGLDTSRARVFKRNPTTKASPFATISNTKGTAAFSTCSAVTGASSVTLMCPNVIAGSDVATQGTNSAHLSAFTDRDGNSHIYCELRENSAPISSTPNGFLHSTDTVRPVSPCYASLPIVEVPLMLTPVTSPSPNESCSSVKNNHRASCNIYNDA